MKQGADSTCRVRVRVRVRGRIRSRVRVKYRVGVRVKAKVRVKTQTTQPTEPHKIRTKASRNVKIHKTAYLYDFCI